MIAPTFHAAYEFTDGLASVTDDTGSTLVAADGRLLGARWVRTGYFLRGLAPVQVVPGPNEKWGYVDRDGQVCIEPTFLEAHPFHGPLAEVHTGVWHSRQKRWITTKGELVGDAFDHTTGFAEDLAWVYTNASTSFACIDADGRAKLDRRFRSAGSFSGGLCAVSELGSTKFGYVDREGRTVIPDSFDEAHPFAEGRAVVRAGARYRLIDEKGAFIGDPFDRVMGAFSEGLVAVRLGEGVGFVDRDGAMVVPPTLAEAYAFHEGLAYAAKKVGNELLWGHIDRTGAWVVEPTLQWTNRFVDGLAPAKHEGLFGFVDRTGRWVVPPRWKQMQPRFSDDRAWVQLP